MSTRPFKVLGIQQIAIGGPDKNRLRKLWVDMFGLEVTGNFVSERENVDEDICAMGKGPFKVEVDLMQPLDPEKKPAVHATPLNHVGLWVDDLPKAVEWLSANGVRFAPGGIRRGAAGCYAEALQRRYRSCDERQRMPMRYLPAHSRRDSQSRGDDVEPRAADGARVGSARDAGRRRPSGLRKRLRTIRRAP